MKEITIICSKSDAKTLQKKATGIVCGLKDVIRLEKYPKLTINVHSTRKSYDKALGRKTESWHVGSASNDNYIHILHPEAFEKFSTHNKSEFDGVLKREIVHIYLNMLSNHSYVPYWLNEGLANNLSGQGLNSQGSAYYIEQSFTSKLTSSNDWNSRVNDGAYSV